MDIFGDDINEIATDFKGAHEHEGYMPVDGLLYQEQEEMSAVGYCGPNNQCTYNFLSGVEGLSRIVGLLDNIGNNNAIYAIDFETGPRQLAPVDPETGAFDLSRLSYSISTSPKESGSEPYTSTVFLMSISTRKNHSYVVDVREMLQLDRELFLQSLGKAAVNGRAVGQNLAFECRFIRNMCGVDVKCDFDPMIATHILYAGLPDPDIEWANPAIKRPRVAASLGAILKREMRIEIDKSVRDLFLLMHPECGLTDTQVKYVALDTALLLELREILLKKLKAKNLDKVWYQIEAPFIPILARISYEGVNVNISRIMELQREAMAEIEELGHQWDVKYPRVPINSPQQVLLWAQKKFPKYNIDKADAVTLEELNKIEQDVDLTLLLAYRKVYKIDSTYLRPWIVTSRNPITGRIHCEYKQAETDTGRLSSSSPNLQNVTGRGPWAKIRDCFVASPGNVIIDCDYSQFEVRALADMAGEPGMIDFFCKSQAANNAMAAFLEAHPDIFEVVDADDEAIIDSEEYNTLRRAVKANDFHTLNAVALFGDRFTNNNNAKEKGELRSQAKGLSFGIPYGISAIKVAAQFKITKEAAQKLIDEYFRQWPRVQAYLDWCKRQARYQKEVYSVTGRKRFFEVPEAFRGMSTAIWKDAYNALWSKAERESSNAPIQGINGDVLKMACILMDDDLRKYKARLILLVHDEIVADCPEEHKKIVNSLMEKHMIEAARRCNLLTVPIETSSKIGDHWRH